MKKFLVITFLLITIISAGYIVFTTRKNKQLDKNLLSTVIINNIEYNTTGAITDDDKNSSLAVTEGIQIIAKGEIQTSLFNIKLPGNGTITVELKKPYDKSKEYFLDWLKKNNYTHINTESFNYVNLD